MAFFGGSTGVIYRQFSVTIVSAMVLSVFVALILTPALTATLAQEKSDGESGNGWFSRRFPAWPRSRPRARQVQHQLRARRRALCTSVSVARWSTANGCSC
jgi:multidrug efflux pump subunit AcrB